MLQMEIAWGPWKPGGGGFLISLSCMDPAFRYQLHVCPWALGPRAKGLAGRKGAGGSNRAVGQGEESEVVNPQSRELRVLHLVGQPGPGSGA